MLSICSLTHALGGADGSQAGNTGPDHQHLGGRYLAGGGDLAGEEAPEVLGSLHHGPVPRDVRHRAQRIHLLRTRDARDAVHGHDRRAALGEPGEQFGILRRVQEADQGLAGLKPRRLFLFGATHLENNVGPRPEFIRVGSDGATGRFVSGIGIIRRGAGVGLDRNLETQFDQLGGHVRGGGHALFARV